MATSGEVPRPGPVDGGSGFETGFEGVGVIIMDFYDRCTQGIVGGDSWRRIAYR